MISASRAVICKPIGAEGIKIRAGEGILLAGDPLFFAGAVIRLLTEPGLAAKLQMKGRSWVEWQYERVATGI